ncbi:MAG: hypothetical protein P4K86_05745 [Terracidiphilus sp.]|nr:hypothetical protein [Terracidiphilus sp.]MDR3775699.1 hypothetical protein [Terracidiphilus sp.]
MKLCLRLILPLISLACVSSMRAQTIHISCPLFVDNANQHITCIEALLTNKNYHLTLASLPTSNGFGPGIVLTHSFTGTTNGQQLDISAIGAVTTNSSWFAGGDATWSLPFGSSDLSTDERNLSSAATKNWYTTSLHLNASHRSVRTLYFYGSGSRSPATKYVYAEDDTWGEFDAHIHIARDLMLTGESRLEATTLPPPSDPTSVVLNVPSGQTPGIAQQPLYFNNSVGLDTRVYKKLRSVFQAMPVGPPHLQPIVRMELENKASVRFQHPTDGSAFAFRQFRFEGDERFSLLGELRNGFVAKDHPFTYHFLCQDQNIQRKYCNLMMFDIKSRLVLSNTSSPNQIPFYLQPTLGGNDIEGNVTLRGWDDYRFRGRDAALLQFEADYLLRDPFGVYAFYDGGAVAPNPGGLALSNFRNDGGIGVFARVQGSIAAQTYYAWGRGNGGRWSFNFSKVF